MLQIRSEGKQLFDEVAGLSFKARWKPVGRNRGTVEPLKAFRRGWYVGSEAFRQEQLAQMEGKLGQHHAGELRRETAEPKAAELLLRNCYAWAGAGVS